MGAPVKSTHGIRVPIVAQSYSLFVFSDECYTSTVADVQERNGFFTGILVDQVMQSFACVSVWTITF